MVSGIYAQDVNGHTNTKTEQGAYFTSNAPTLMSWFDILLQLQDISTRRAGQRTHETPDA